MRIFVKLRDFISAKKKLIFITLANLLVVILIGLSSYAYFIDYKKSSFFLGGIKLGGVSVGLRSFNDSVKLLESGLEKPLKKPFMMKWGARSTAYMPVADLVDVDSKAMLRHGIYIQSLIPSWLRIYHRAIDNPLDIEVPLNMSYDCSILQTRLNVLSRKTYILARDATVSVTSKIVKVIPSKNGQKMDFDYAWKKSIELMPTKNRTLKLKLKVVKPKVYAKNIGKIIVIDKDEHMLRLFKGSKKLKEYPIACGSPGYPTPDGLFSIAEKRKWPTWTNPHMGWSAGMPESIPPGRDNPLGTRAMDLSASGIRIHGTPSSWSIGSSVSHGCIRMYLSDAEDLFDRVEVGMPVYIFSE